MLSIDAAALKLRLAVVDALLSIVACPKVGRVHLSLIEYRKVRTPVKEYK